MTAFFLWLYGVSEPELYTELCVNTTRKKDAQPKPYAKKHIAPIVAKQTEHLPIRKYVIMKYVFLSIDKNKRTYSMGKKVFSSLGSIIIAQDYSTGYL